MITVASRRCFQANLLNGTRTTDGERKMLSLIGRVAVALLAQMELQLIDVARTKAKGSHPDDIERVDCR